jgi:hypothetical protein
LNICKLRTIKFYKIGPWLTKRVTVSNQKLHILLFSVTSVISVRLVINEYKKLLRVQSSGIQTLLLMTVFRTGIFLNFNFCLNASGISPVVEYLSRHPKAEGSNLARWTPVAYTIKDL